MTEEKAQFVLGEIRNIKRYERLISSVTLDLQEISSQIESVQLPKSSIGHEKIAPTVSPSDKTSKVLKLMSDEQSLMEERRDFENRRQIALKYRTEFFEKCPDDEVSFSSDFFGGMPYEGIMMKHSVSHPYRHALRLIKTVLR